MRFNYRIPPKTKSKQRVMSTDPRPDQTSQLAASAAALSERICRVNRGRYLTARAVNKPPISPAEERGETGGGGGGGGGRKRVTQSGLVEGARRGL